MAEVLDILMPYKVGAPADIGCYSFTVNTGGPLYVGIAVPAAGVGTLYNAHGKSKFARGDSFTILSFGLVMPLSFQFDRSKNVTYFPFIKMYLAGSGQTTSHTYYFQELTSGSEMFLYMENYDTAMDVYIDVPQEPPSAVAASGFSFYTVTTTGFSHVLTSAVHGLLTGSVVQFIAQTALPGGILAGADYYVNRLNANTFRVYSTLALAVAGGASDINVSTAGTGTQWFVTYLNNEKFTLLSGLSFPSDLAVSMVGVPAALDKSIQYITPYFKVLHNFPLT